MTLDQLRIFLTVVHHLHFTRAAEELNLTQPAVSAAIQALESRYQVKLFHRLGRQVTITAAGELLWAEAQKLLDHVALIERGLQALNDLQQGELRMGASFTIGNYWLPSKISQFKRQYPEILVRSTLADSQSVCEGVALGNFDLGLLTGAIPIQLGSTLQQDIVGYDHLRIVVGQSHPWFKRSSLTLSDLEQTGWIMQEPNSAVQQTFEQTLQTWNINLCQLKVLMVVSSSEMVKAALEDGLGAAVLPELVIQKEIRFNLLHTLSLMPSKKVKQALEIVQPIIKIKHLQRFQTQTGIAFEQLLTAQI